MNIAGPRLKEVSMKLKIGRKAPAFTLPDQNGKPVKLSDFKGQWVLLYFYPKDNTPGCTKEACGMRDKMPDFKRLGFSVLGISVDNPTSHRKFADRYDLCFPLLADEEKKIVKTYGVWGKKKFMGKEFMGTRRQSFLVDPEGTIVKIYEKVNPQEHAQEVLEDLKAYTK